MERCVKKCELMRAEDGPIEKLEIEVYGEKKKEAKSVLWYRRGFLSLQHHTASCLCTWITHFFDYAVLLL